MFQFLVANDTGNESVGVVQIEVTEKEIGTLLAERHHQVPALPGV